MAATKTSAIIDITGQRFGRWTALYLAEVRDGVARWWCHCDCGTEKLVLGAGLRTGHSQSCGCLQIETATTHGDAGGGEISSEYRSWQAILQRCLNPKSKDFKRYGGRGITVCERWGAGTDNLTGFENFLADMGRKPTQQHTLDRYPNVNGNYEPGNCRWATPKEQANNRRNTVWVQVGDEMQPLSKALAHVPNGRQRWGQWVQRKGLSAQEAYERVVERAARGVKQGQI